MLIRNSKAFMRGLLLLVTFIAVFVVFFLPVFPGHIEGEKVNGLVYADNLFNTLSKGSSAKYLIPGVDDDEYIQKVVDGLQNKNLDLTVTFKNTDGISGIIDQINHIGLEAAPVEGGLHIKGDMQKLLTVIVADSQSLYNNKADEVTARYDGKPGLEVVKGWHRLSKNMIKPLQKVDMVAEANVVNTVLTKGIELGFNFYGISAVKVSDNIPLVAGVLIFYVIYTMWYGFAIFELFEGIGLTMKKGAKQEA